MRKSEIKRKTKETDICLSLDLDGGGNGDIDTGIGFLDHMLELFKAHGGFDLSVSCAGDIGVDFHHSAEDIGICLGRAFCGALGGKGGIRRYGDMILPMDDALVLCAADISGRPFLAFDVPIPSQRVGDFDTELVREFMSAFAENARVTLHIKLISGRNSHHIIEAVFKALARTLSRAARIENADGRVPSTKGIL